LRGRWIAEHTVFLDNRQMNARVGFFVLTPLQIGPAGEAVLVQRGWAPRDQLDRSRLPALATPAGEVEVDGWLAASPTRLYEFDGAASGPIRQNLALEDFGRETGLKLLPVSLLQREAPTASADGLSRQWPRPAVDVHKHYGYAFQWFALAALMTGLYVWFQLIRPRFRRGT
jgi:surfeit locus 1 family protein